MLGILSANIFWRNITSDNLHKNTYGHLEVSEPLTQNHIGHVNERR